MTGYRTTLAVLALLSSSVAALAAPAVTLSLSVGSPTQKVTVSGTGFAANALIDIYFDTADLCLTFADATGKATCIITTPKDAQPQQHWISMAQRSTLTGAQKPFTVRTDMPQFHGMNARHAGVNPFENTLNVNNVGDLDLLWSAPAGAGVTGSPVVSGGIVYAGSYDGKLFAFNALTGATIAGFPVKAGTQIWQPTPAVAAGKVFIGASDGKLYGFNAATGAVLAGFPKTLGAAAIQSSPSIANGNLYIGCNDGKLYAFNITTGAAVTGFPVTTTAGATIYASPTVAGSNVYIGTSNGVLYALDALTGALRYKYSKGTTINSTLAASGTSGFFGDTDGYIHGVSLSNGFSLPSFPLYVSGTPVDGSPAVAQNKVFALTAPVYAAWLHGGVTPAWTRPLSGTQHTSPMAANGVVYVQTDYRLYALSASTGDVLWSTGVQQFNFGSPVVANGIVYAPDSQGGGIYAYSVNGQAPAARLPGGALGVKPALSALKPNVALKVGQPRLAPSPEDE